MGNGRLIQLEGFKSMDVWAVEGYQPIIAPTTTISAFGGGIKNGKATGGAARLRRFRTMIILRPRLNHHHHHVVADSINNNNNNLTLINAIRLSIPDEQELLKLGTVAFVVRLSSEDAGFDDLYYIQKFAARAFAYKTVGPLDRQQPWNASPHWTFFNASTNPDCFRGFSPIRILDVPIVSTSDRSSVRPSEEEETECVLYFPTESTLIVSQLMQNNDFRHAYLYGMTLSRLKLTIWEIICLKLTGFGGHLHTPKSYLDRLMTFSSSKDTNANSYEEVLHDFFMFHGQLMDLKWDRVLCLYGGPSMYSAKRIRKESIRNWPSIAHGGQRD